MNKCFLITFDLKNPGLNRDKLITAIKTAPWVRLSNNAYAIVTTKSAAEIRDILLSNLYQGDTLYVGQLDNHAAWYGLSDEVSNWLRSNQKR